jgi:AraC-like DNA-binding protein
MAASRQVLAEGEDVLVAISGAANSEALIRRGVRLARRRGGLCMVVTVVGAGRGEELDRSGTVTEAIYGAGYNSNGRFYAQSNDVLGMTPSRYRAGGVDTTIRFAVGECSLGAVLVAATELGVCAILIGDDPDALARDLQDQFPRAELTGHPVKRLPHHASFLFQAVEGESLLLQLDMEGIAASSGSACTSGSLEPSHVILALGYPRDRALGSLRLSVGKGNTDEDIDLLLDRLPGMVARLRTMAPISAA